MLNGPDIFDLDIRTRDVFDRIVRHYMETGIPVGSRTLSRAVPFSPATIRNIMGDLQDMGLLEASHISAGRMPSHRGLRLFVDGLLENGEMDQSEIATLTREYAGFSESRSAQAMFEKVSNTLSSLSQSAGLVVAPRQNSKPVRHIEFISLSSEQSLVVIVLEDGSVENRLITLPTGITPDLLRQAGHFLSEKLYGRTIADMEKAILEEITARRDELGKQMTELVKAGLAIRLDDGQLIVRGTSQLLADPQARDDLEKLQQLMDMLESRETVSKLLDEANHAEGIKIYIGAENPIFEGSGHSMVLSPFRNAQSHIVGAIGVIGPTRLNYARVIPSVNFMAELVGRQLSSHSP